jgi:hypothetical protein
MFNESKPAAAKTSSQPARTRAFGPNPSQLDAEQAAAQAGQLDATQRPAVLTDEGRAAASWEPDSTADTATGEGLRSASPALATRLRH